MFLVLPDIAVTVFVNDVDINIRISDHGGGIQPSLGSKIWAWSFTTSTPAHDLDEPASNGAAAHQEVDNGVLNPNLDMLGMEARDLGLSGCGVGLPMSRAYANFFGGSLHSTL